MTIGVPGNLPYVITVGAMSDNYTPTKPQDDILASFSSTGPTHEGFVKPELVAPGGHMLATMQNGINAWVPRNSQEPPGLSGGLLLGQAVERAEPPNQFHRMNPDDGPVGK